jgi:hypothetical protein
MIHRHPVQPCIKVTFGIGHQFASEGAQVRDLGRVLGRNRESEMMPIVLTPLRKGLGVGILRGRTEHSRVGAIPGDALTFEIRDVFRKWRRAESLALMADDPRHDDDPPTW